MRRSTGLGGSRIIRAMGRAIVGPKPPSSSSAGARFMPASTISIGSAPTTPAALSASSSRSSLACVVDEDDWESVEEEEREGEDVEFGGAGFGGLSERFVFGEVPSQKEAEDAVSEIQQMFAPVTLAHFTDDEYPSTSMSGVYSSESDSDWIEPPMHLSSSRPSQSYERGKVLDAFRLLQINPSVQRMVVSLSSDKDVWDAIMKNEEVQEFKNSVYEAESREAHSSDEGDNDSILRWILGSTKAKMTKFFDKIRKLANEIFGSEEKDQEIYLFNDVVRSSFMLAIVVFIFIIATRVRNI